MQRTLLSVFLFFGVFFISACGGGGSDSDDDSNPTVSVSLQSVNVDEGSEITVTPTVRNEDQVISYSWSQNSGPSVSFALASKSLTFTAPTVSEDTVITFTLRTETQAGTTLTNELSVTVINSLPPTVVSASFNSGTMGEFLSTSVIVMLAQGNEFTASDATNDTYTFDADLRALPRNAAITFAVKSSAQETDFELLSFVGTAQELIDSLEAADYEVINFEINAFSVAATALSLGNDTAPSFAEIRASRSNLVLEKALELATSLQRFFDQNSDFTFESNTPIYRVLADASSRGDFVEQAKTLLGDDFSSARAALLEDLSVSQINASALVSEHYFIATDGLSGLGKLTLNDDNTGTFIFSEIAYSGTWSVNRDDIVFDALGIYSPISEEYVETEIANNLIYTIDLFSASPFSDYTTVTLSRKNSSVTSSEAWIKKTPLSFTRAINIPSGEYAISYFEGLSNPVRDETGRDPSGNGSYTQSSVSTELALLSIDATQGYVLMEPDAYSDADFDSGFIENTSAIQDADLVIIEGAYGTFSLGFHDTTDSLALGITYDGFIRSIIQNGTDANGDTIYLDNVLPSANSGKAFKKDSTVIDPSLRGFYLVEVFDQGTGFELTEKVFRFLDDGTAITANWLDRNNNGVVDEGEWFGDQFGSVTWSFNTVDGKIEMMQRQCDISENNTSSVCNSFITEVWELWQSSNIDSVDTLRYLQTSRLVRKNNDGQVYFADGASRIGSMSELASSL